MLLSQREIMEAAGASRIDDLIRDLIQIFRDELVKFGAIQGDMVGKPDTVGTSNDHEFFLAFCRFIQRHSVPDRNQGVILAVDNQNGAFHLFQILPGAVHAVYEILGREPGRSTVFNHIVQRSEGRLQDEQGRVI